MRRKSRLTYMCTMVAVLITTVGCATGKLHRMTPPEPQTDATYIVYPPDVLQIAIVPEDRLTRNCIVRPDGFITFDLIGDVHVAGMTPPQIDDLVTERLEEYIKNVEVAVSVEGTQSKQFYLMGEVNRTGPNRLDGDITARDAIGMAGGFTRRASKSKVFVVRAGLDQQEVFRVDMAKMLRTGDNSGDVPLMPGDVVLVKPNAFAVVGYALDTLLFPIQGLLGMSTSVATQGYQWSNNPFSGGGRVGGGGYGY
jgi:polysaccharide export outer membrane protein